MSPSLLPFGLNFMNNCTHISNLLFRDKVHPWGVYSNKDKECTTYVTNRFWFWLIPFLIAFSSPLERKLNKLKKSSKLLAALSEKRADCLRSFLLNDSIATVDSDEYQSKHWNHEDFQLDEQCSRADPDNVVQTLYRHLQPIQAVTIGETVELIKYDQLEQQQRQQEP